MVFFYVELWAMEKHLVEFVNLLRKPGVICEEYLVEFVKNFSPAFASDPGRTRCLATVPSFEPKPE